MPKSSRFLSQLFASPGDSEALRRPRRTLLGLGSSTVPNSTKSGSEGFLSFKFLHGSNRAGALATVVSGTISSVRGRQKPRKIAELLLQARARAPGGGRFAVRVREKLEVGARQPEPCWDAFRTEALCWAWAWLPWFRKAEAWLPGFVPCLQPAALRSAAPQTPPIERFFRILGLPATASHDEVRKERRRSLLNSGRGRSFVFVRLTDSLHSSTIRTRIRGRSWPAVDSYSSH